MFGRKIMKRIGAVILSLWLGAGVLSAPCHAQSRISGETEDITVTVRWEHGENPGDTRPDSVVLYLENNGTRVSTLRLTGKNAQTDGSWAGTFRNVPVYAVGGSAVEYELKAEPVPMYVPEIMAQPRTAAVTAGDFGDKVTPAAQSGYSVSGADLIVANKGGSYYVWTMEALSDGQQARLAELINDAGLPGLGKNLTVKDTVFRSGLPAEFLGGEVTVRKGGEGAVIEFGKTAAWSLFYTGKINVQESRGAELELRYAPNVSPETVSVSVTKKWAGSESVKHPEEAWVSLFRDGELFGDRVRLSDDNDWSYTWEGLEAEHSWTVDETATPPGYVKTVQREGSAYTVTNILREEQPGQPGTPKTGDISKPLAAWGMLMLSSGMALFGFFLLLRDESMEKGRKKQAGNQ